MNKEHIDAFSNAFLNIMPQLGISSVTQEQTRTCSKLIDVSEVVSIVGVIGDMAGNVIYSMEESVAKQIASYMMGGMDVESFDEIAQSAISELSNMLAANACIGLSETGLAVDISTPTLMHGNFSVSGSYDHVTCLDMLIESDLKFSIYISLEQKGKG